MQDSSDTIQILKDISLRASLHSETVTFCILKKLFLYCCIV